MRLAADPVANTVPRPSRGSGHLREIVMGSQDNLTNVLAVVLGVAIGSGDASTVALAGLAAGLAEAISMGGVLYTATRAERDLAVSTGAAFGKRPAAAALATFAAALAAALVPLAPFAMLPLGPAMVTAAVLSVAALFALGAWTGGITGDRWWRCGSRFVLIGGLAAAAAAVVGVVLGTNGA
jgi:VIT1/CCC1 family predicted Fe2+/Mn2+ transporter